MLQDFLDSFFYVQNLMQMIKEIKFHIEIIQKAFFSFLHCWFMYHHQVCLWFSFHRTIPLLEHWWLLLVCSFSKSVQDSSKWACHQRRIRKMEGHWLCIIIKGLDKDVWYFHNLGTSWFHLELALQWKEWHTLFAIVIIY